MVLRSVRRCGESKISFRASAGEPQPASAVSSQACYWRRRRTSRAAVAHSMYAQNAVDSSAVR